MLRTRIISEVRAKTPVSACLGFRNKRNNIAQRLWLAIECGGKNVDEHLLEW